jgi:hypothetical protein
MQVNGFQQDGGAVVLPSNNAKKRSLILKSQTPTVENFKHGSAPSNNNASGGAQGTSVERSKPSTHNGSIQQYNKNYLEIDTFLLDGGTGSVIENK